MSDAVPSPLLRFRHGIEYAVVASIGVVFKALPRGAVLAVGTVIGQVGWWTRMRRGLVLTNLAQALPDASPRERRRIGARAARNFGRTVSESPKLTTESEPTAS